MTLYYIPGAIGNGTDYYQNDDPFKLGDVQYPANWPKDGMDGVTLCTYEPCAIDGEAFVIEEVRNGAVISYTGTPRDPAEVAAHQKANRQAPILTQIAQLEGSITNRMWREDAVSSEAVMDFGPDDARTGKTATQFIAFVNDSIAALRSAL